jgi:hypothetical protein
MFYQVIVCWFILIWVENILYSNLLSLPYINLDGVLQIVLDGGHLYDFIASATIGAMGINDL